MVRAGQSGGEQDVRKEGDALPPGMVMLPAEQVDESLPPGWEWFLLIKLDTSCQLEWR